MDALTKVVAESHTRIASPARVLVACSGGADSVALLLALLPLRQAGAVSLHCVHVNHGLRFDAGEDAAFVAALCKAHQVSVSTCCVHVEAGGSMEERARTARYRALRAAAECCQADAIALGHHMDDQAETVMLRLLHGAGGRGLSAMKELSQGLWRPLLSVRMDALIVALQAAGQRWCTDSTNADTRFLRNRIRAELLPLMSRINGSAVENIARTAEVFAAEDAYWRMMADEWLGIHASLHPACIYLSWGELLAQHPAMQRQCLLRFTNAAGLTPSFAHVEQLRSLAEGAYANLPGGWRGYRSVKRLFLLSPVFHRLPLGFVAEGANEELRRSKTETFDMDKMQGAVVRYRQSGDRIKPLGFSGTRKLSDYFIDRKVDWPLRDNWPIVCKDSAVLWVPGIGMAQDAAVTERTRRSGVFRYVGQLPDEYIGFRGDSP